MTRRGGEKLHEHSAGSSTYGLHEKNEVPPPGARTQLVHGQQYCPLGAAADGGGCPWTAVQRVVHAPGELHDAHQSLCIRERWTGVYRLQAEGDIDAQD